jgi:hypothetical protein
MEYQIMQNRSAKNTPLDMEKWGEIINGWNQSGESQKAYCQRLGLNLNTFSHARSKWLSRNKTPTKFIPVTIKKSVEAKKLSSAFPIILKNQSGYKLYLSTALSAEELSQLFQLSGWRHA